MIREQKPTVHARWRSRLLMALALGCVLLLVATIAGLVVSQFSTSTLSLLRTTRISGGHAFAYGDISFGRRVVEISWQWGKAIGPDEDQPTRSTFGRQTISPANGLIRDTMPRVGPLGWAGIDWVSDATLYIRPPGQNAIRLLFINWTTLIAIEAGVTFAVCALWSLSRRSQVRAKLGLCPGCGYDIRASPIQCPECGLAVMAGNGTASDRN